MTILQERSQRPSGKHFTNPVKADDGEFLLSFRKSISEILEKSRAMTLSIDQSSEKLRGMRDRLPMLEAAVKPLEAQSRHTKGLDDKIDQAISSARTVMETLGVVSDLQSVLEGDARANVEFYTKSISKLERAVEFLTQNFQVAVDRITDAKEFLAKSERADKYRIYKLNESLQRIISDGAGRKDGWDSGLLKSAPGKVEMVFKSLLFENSKAMILTEQNDPPPPGILLPQVTRELQTIVEWFNLNRNADNLLNMFWDSRLTSIKLSLQGLDSHYLSNPSKYHLNKVEWGDLEAMIDLWNEHIPLACTVLFKTERRVCYRVFEKLEKAKWIQCWGKLSKEGFGPFLAFGEGVAESKSDPHKLFGLLDMYKTMEDLLPHIFEVFEGDDVGCQEVKSRSRDLLKRISQRASQTVWDFGESVRSGAGDLPVNGDRSLLCSYVVNYVKCLVDGDLYAPTMAKIIRIEKKMLWQGGEELKAGNHDEPLSLVAIHMMHALQKHLVKQAKSYEDSSLAAIFLCNSFKYMISRAKASEVGPLLGEAWAKDFDEKLKQHSMVYVRRTWDTTLSYLSRDGLSPLLSTNGKGAARDLARKRLKSFNLSFEETFQRHINWVVPDEDLKTDIQEAVRLEMVPAYRNFLQTYRGLLEQGSTIAKYIKFSPEEVEKRIGSLLHSKAPDVKPRNSVHVEYV